MAYGLQEKIFIFHHHLMKSDMPTQNHYILNWLGHFLKTWNEYLFIQRDYVNKFKKTNDSFEDLMDSEEYFRDKLTQFLFSPKGAIFQVLGFKYIPITKSFFQPNFWFSEPLKCGEPAPDVLLQTIPFSHKRFDSSTVWIPAMREVQKIVAVWSLFKVVQFLIFNFSGNSLQ